MTEWKASYSWACSCGSQGTTFTPAAAGDAADTHARDCAGVLTVWAD